MSEDETIESEDVAMSGDSTTSGAVSEAEMAAAMNLSSESGVDEDHREAVLSIETPVTVTLARKKERLDRILGMAPGAMLTFDTHCDEPLILEAGGHPIATGETVKIGDKFGIRVRAFIDPEDLE